MHVEQRGCTLLVDMPAGQEKHAFTTEAEAEARAAFVNEALSWVGTPFRDCADVKGSQGAVDCAMLLTRCAVDSGLLEPFDPRPYAPRHMLHSAEEHFLRWVRDTLGGHEVPQPRPGDVVVWQFGRCFSHGAIFVGNGEVVHAYAAAGCVLRSRMDEPLLTHLPLTGGKMPRPVKFFDMWSVGK